MEPRGISGFLTARAGNLYGLIERGLTRLMLERRFGLPPEATKHIGLDEFGLAEEGRQGYGPSPWGALRRVLPVNEVSTSDVFIDFGCGMGNVLLEAASHYPFRRVIGVDLVPDFTAIASEAAARNRHRLRSEIEVVTADVLEYPIPDDVTVVYLANPFLGEVFDALIAKLVASVDRVPRVLRIVYVAPQEAARLKATGRVRFVRHGRRAIRRWAPADYLHLYEIVPQAEAA